MCSAAAGGATCGAYVGVIHCLSMAAKLRKLDLNGSSIFLGCYSALIIRYEWYESSTYLKHIRFFF